MDKAMSSMDALVDKEKRTMYRPGNALVVEDVVSSGKASANHLKVQSWCFSWQTGHFSNLQLALGH